MLVEIAVSVLSGGLAGLTAPWVTQAPERRRARAAVRGALWEHRGAWARAEWSNEYQEHIHPHLEEHLQAVESAAFLAQVPRPLVDRFVEAQRLAAEQAYEDEGMITSPAARAEVDAATEALVAYLWRPWLSRLRRVRWRRALPWRRRSVALPPTSGE